MKQFGTTSLLTCILSLILLDLVPIESHSSCKDKRKVEKILKKPLIPIEPIKEEMTTFIKPKIITGEITSKGENWVEISGKLDIEDPVVLDYIKHYGIWIEKKDGNESNKDYTLYPASEFKDDYSFTVKITNLKPDVSYVYYAYVTIVSNGGKPKLLTLRGEKKDLK